MLKSLEVIDEVMLNICLKSLCLYPELEKLKLDLRISLPALLHTCTPLLHVTNFRLHFIITLNQGPNRLKGSDCTSACNMHAKGSVSSLPVSLSAAVARSCDPSVLVYRAQHGVFSRELGLMTAKARQGFTHSYLQMALLISQGKKSLL